MGRARLLFNFSNPLRLPFELHVHWLGLSYLPLGFSSASIFLGMGCLSHIGTLQQSMFLGMGGLISTLDLPARLLLSVWAVISPLGIRQHLYVYGYGLPSLP